MAAIRNFEDLEAWKSAKNLYLQLRIFTVESKLNREYYLRDQLLRAGLSVSNNIAEGFERGGDKEFRRFLIIANGSLAEVKSMLLLISEFNQKPSSESIEDLLTLAQKCINLNKGMIRYLNKKQKLT